MTTDTNPEFVPVTIEEIRAATPRLDPVQQSELFRALVGARQGASVSVSFTYVTQTDSTKVKRRIAGKDYVAMPGVGSEVHFGLVTGAEAPEDGVFRRKKDQVLRFRIQDYARPRGAEAWSWMSVVPAGITQFAITGFLNAEQAPPF